MSYKISDKRVRQIVAEELKQLRESVDHTAIKDVVGRASEFLGALAEFKEECPTAMMNAVTPHIDALQKALEDMLSTPGSYVTAPKKEPKTVSLRAVPEAK